jgi:hypothetical protein
MHMVPVDNSYSGRQYPVLLKLLNLIVLTAYPSYGDTLPLA